MRIINENELLEDSIDILINHFSWTKGKAKKILSAYKMDTIMTRMYEAQEQYLEKLVIEDYNANSSKRST